MRAHTKKRHTRKPTPFQVKKEEAVDWKEAFNEAFGKIPSSAISLKGLRNREEWTQVELSEKIGISQANLSKMESGKRPIGKNMAHRLAEVFKTDYRMFL
jgi:DNA-binding XRE family transcriptional regulator